MAKEDFREKIEKLNEHGIVKICADFYIKPKQRGSNFFVKSPVSADKTWSCCLYPSNNRFYDFAGGQGGDIVGFISYVQGLNNWESLELLSDFYGISGTSERSREERRRMIQKQQQEERRRTERQQGFHNALFAFVDDLKAQLIKYRTALEKGKLEPFSDLWAYILKEAQRTEYKLDILTAADMGTYRRLKPNPDLGLSSDRPMWLLDVLDIMEESGVFHATQEEITEIQAQYRFEMCGRKPGAADRRCGVEW
nr:CHC2 zinc finger domain-containing protein [uncultured Marvinbryantia sp.]